MQVPHKFDYLQYKSKGQQATKQSFIELMFLNTKTGSLDLTYCSVQRIHSLSSSVGVNYWYNKTGDGENWNVVSNLIPTGQPMGQFRFMLDKAGGSESK